MLAAVQIRCGLNVYKAYEMFCYGLLVHWIHLECSMFEKAKQLPKSDTKKKIAIAIFIKLLLLFFAILLFCPYCTALAPMSFGCCKTSSWGCIGCFKWCWQFTEVTFLLWMLGFKAANNICENHSPSLKELEEFKIKTFMAWGPIGSAKGEQVNFRPHLDH